MLGRSVVVLLFVRCVHGGEGEGRVGDDDKRRSPDEEKRLSSLMAIAYVSFGEARFEPLLKVSVATVRGAGAWAGPIYVITDAACAAPATTIPLLVELNGCTKKMAYKYFKTLALRLVPETHLFVLYLDLDVVVAAPVARTLETLPNVRLWLRPQQNETADERPTILGVTQAPIRSSGGWHGGIALLSRRDSGGCLRAWGNAFSTVAQKNSDQAALKSVATSLRPFDEEGSGKPCRFAAIDEERTGTAIPGVFAWPTHTSIEAEEYALFNHFTRTGRLKLKHGITEDDLERAAHFLLSSSEQDLLSSSEQDLLSSSSSSEVGAAFIRRRWRRNPREDVTSSRGACPPEEQRTSRNAPAAALYSLEPALCDALPGEHSGEHADE